MEKMFIFIQEEDGVDSLDCWENSIYFWLVLHSLTNVLI